jgi:putative ABC transport system substrate-binding protein
MIIRREFIALLGGAATRPLAAHAQQPDRKRRIGVLMGTAPTKQYETYLAAFLRQLDEFGWKEGHNTRTEVRWWAGGPQQMRPVVVELLAFSPDVMMVYSNLALAVLKPMAGKVPVVFTGIGDPVGDGFVTSLARPGGNMTGFTGYDGPMGGKWLEVLKETAPDLSRVLAIFHPETPVHQAFLHSIEDSAPHLGIKVTAAGIHDAAEIESAISSFATHENGGMIVLPHVITWANENLFIAMELQHRLPAIFSSPGSVTAGGLVSYAFDFEESFRKSAEYVNRILRGEKPSDLPVQQPTKYMLTFNLKTAKAIGLNIPPTMLARADEVIE